MPRGSRAGRDSDGSNSRASWWARGHHVPHTDNERGANEGLSRREIRALEEENSRPFGKSWWASSAVSRRAADAQRGGKRGGKR